MSRHYSCGRGPSADLMLADADYPRTWNVWIRTPLVDRWWTNQRQRPAEEPVVGQTDVDDVDQWRRKILTADDDVEQTSPADSRQTRPVDRTTSEDQSTVETSAPSRRMFTDHGFSSDGWIIRHRRNNFQIFMIISQLQTVTNNLLVTAMLTLMFNINSSSRHQEYSDLLSS